MLSSVGTDNPEEGPEGLRHYLKAKKAADEHLQTAGIDFAIVRPVSLTNDPGTGSVEVSPEQVSGSEIPREDVAEVLERCVSVSEASGAVFQLSQGKDSISDAMAHVKAA